MSDHTHEVQSLIELLHEKYKPGDPHVAGRFVDPQGFRASVLRLEKAYLDQLKDERAGK